MIEHLIDANSDNKINKKLVKDMFGIAVTNKDLNNYKQRMNLQLYGDKEQNQLLEEYIQKLVVGEPNTTIKVKKDSTTDLLDCLFIQTAQMKKWYQSFPEVVHIDGTFKVNKENYILLVILVQNANLRGVPVALSFIRAESAENLEFVYRCFKETNDLTRSQVVMIDKDLDNVAILPQFFESAKILLCTFHVLKYLKTKIYEHVSGATERLRTIQVFRQLLYTRKDDDEEIMNELRRVSSEPFTEYFEVNWLACREMWQIKHRQGLLYFNTNTNNHVERFNRSIKVYVNSQLHLAVSLSYLLNFVDELREQERALEIKIKIKTYNPSDTAFLRCFGNQLVDKAIHLIREEQQVWARQPLAMEESSENHWNAFQSDKPDRANNSILRIYTSAIVTSSRLTVSSVIMLCTSPLKTASTFLITTRQLKSALQ